MRDAGISKQTNRKKRNPITAIFLLPAILFIGAIGWSLSWIGTQQKQNAKPKTAQTNNQGNNIDIMAIPLEQESEITA